MKKFGTGMLALLIVLTMMNTNLLAGDYKSNFYIEYDQQVFKYTGKTVSITIDGKTVETGEMPAIILNSLTLVPAREVFESQAFNADVEWNGAENEVYITYADKFIKLKINSNVAYVNNVPVLMDTSAKLIRDTSKKNPKTMIPLRFVSETLGFKVEWEGQSYTAVVTSQGPTEPEEIPTEPVEMPTDEEQLDQLSPEKAMNTLPTALMYAPIQWSAETNSGGIGSVVTSAIVEESNPIVDITDVEYVSKEAYFKINASGPITFAKTSRWEDKYIVEIYNSNYKLTNDTTLYEKKYSNNPIVYAVRGSKPDSDRLGRPVTKVVFDLLEKDASYSLSISADRMSLVFEIGGDKITGVNLGQTDQGDYVIIQGTYTPKINSFRLSNPDRIVFDMPGFVSLLGSQKADNVQGQYINAIRTAQFDNQTTRVVVETEGQANYKIEDIGNNQVRIQFMEPTYDNIIYDNVDKPVITLENSAQIITIDGITYEDNYNDREYIIHLPGNYEDIFGEGGVQIMDDVFESIQIVENANGFTDLIIKQKEIYEFRIESDATNVYIKAYKPKELYSQIVVVDIGHGGKDPGAIDSSRTVYEKDLNFGMGMALKALLDGNQNIKVYYTRTDDTYLALQERVAIANEVEADFFVSIHNNAFTPQHNGTETLYFKAPMQSGLDSIELASIIHNKVVSGIGLFNRGLKDRNDLYVIKNTNMPAVIIEVGFVSSVIDLPIITNIEVQKKVAQALYDGIVQTFQEYPTGR